MKQIITITVTGQKKIEKHIFNQIKHCLKKIGLTVEKITSSEESN